MTDALRTLTRMRSQRATLLRAVDWKHRDASWSELEKAAARHLYTVEIAALDEAIAALEARAVRRAAGA